MEITIRKLDLVTEAQILTVWLSSEEWPFHGNSNLSHEKIAGMIQDGAFDGTNHQTFWVLSPKEDRIGLVRLFDLDDIGDGSPLFDIRIMGEFRGKGIGYQAVSWLTRHLFETWPNLTRIEGNTRADNIAMRRVFRKCHYAKEGHHRKAWKASSGELFDAIHYGILRDDWERKIITPIHWDDEATL